MNWDWTPAGGYMWLLEQEEHFRTIFKATINLKDGIPKHVADLMKGKKGDPKKQSK
jgi:hypothetical protein